MGCDIHLYKEKKVNGKWVTADKKWVDEYGEGCTDVPWRDRFTDRDYDLFGFLCDGVRRDHGTAFKARGIPFNVCPEVKAVNEKYGEDGHSHSYLSLSELKDAWEFLQTKTVTVSGMKDRQELQKLLDSIESEGETDWMLMFPYCQWTTSQDYDEFSIEVPASFKLSGLKNLIDLFEGCDGDDHRIVFWFDN